MEHEGRTVARERKIQGSGDFECRIWNTEEETRWGVNAINHSIIDLTLSTGNIELNWFITGGGYTPHGSDHAVIGWEILGLGNVATLETVTGWDASGWSTVGAQGKEEKEKREKTREEARATWEANIERSQAELGSKAGIDQEAAHIRASMEDTLNRHAKKRRVCARSKAWWTQEISELRKKRGKATRERRQNPAACGEAQQTLRRAIRRAKRTCWSDFVQGGRQKRVVESGKVYRTKTGGQGAGTRR